MLSSKEKELHKEVMVQNYEHMVSVGYSIPMEQLLLLIEKHEERIPELMEGAPTLPQVNMCDDLSSTCRGIMYCNSPRQMLQKGHQISGCVSSLSCATYSTRHTFIPSGDGHNECMEYDTGCSQENELKMHLNTLVLEKLPIFEKSENISVNPGSFVMYCETHIRENPTNKFHTHSITNPRTFEEIEDWGKKKQSLSVKQNFCVTMKHSKPASHDMCFTQKTHLAVLGKTQSEKRSHVCASCGKNDKWKRPSEVQEKVLAQDKPSNCETCNKSVIQKDNCITREQTQSGEKTYQYEKCGESVENNLLICLEKTLAVEKQHGCAICSKSCMIKGQLASFEQTYTDDRPYKCATCEKSFKKKALLTSHMKTHIVEKPYKCATCSKSFIWKSDLTYHERTHTGDRPYKCTTCDKSFPLKSSLTTHEKSHISKRKRPKQY